MLRTRFNTLFITSLVIPFSAACATKGFVTESVDGRATVIEDRVAAVEGNLDGVAEETRTNTARIGEVDETATSALSNANSAGTAAEGAQGTADDAVGRVSALEEASRQLVSEVVLSEAQGGFNFAASSMPDAAAASLDAFLQRVQATGAAVHFEVEGHTDGTGDPVYNEQLGLQRAEVVRRYLHDQHQIALHRISVISYGESQPMGPNETSEGRAQNRRVVVRAVGQ